MPRHRKFYHSSDSSSNDNCVPGVMQCGNKCPTPFDYEENEVFVLSANLCDSSACPREEEPCDELYAEDTLSECPEIVHCVEVKKPKRCKKTGNCDGCGYKKCKCEEAVDWSVILCDEFDVAEDSSCSDLCTVPITPCAPCNIGVRSEFPYAPEEDSCLPKKCQKKCDSPRKHEVEKCKWQRDDCASCLYPKKQCRCKSDDGEHKAMGRTIKIGFMDKRTHPQKHRIVTTDRCLSVDGVAGSSIHMIRGHTYLLEIEASDKHNFYFTHDMMGGPVGQAATPSTFDPVPLPGSFQPSQGKIVYFKADDSVPKRFYYQSTSDRCMGGDVFIHSSRK